MDLQQLVLAAWNARQDPALADQLARRLRSTPDCRRQILLDNDPRLASVSVCQALLRQCEAFCGDDLQGYADAASAAIAVAESLRGIPETLHADLRAEAWAELGNCLRTRGELASAISAFEVASQAVETGSGDPLLWGRLLFFRAAAARETGAVDDALDDSLEALEAFEEIGEELLAAKCEIALATSYASLLDWSSVVRHLGNALARPVLWEEPETLVVAVHNLAAFLAEMDHPQLAWRITEKAGPLYGAVRGAGRRRVALTGLRGTVQRQLGFPASAARLFEAASQGSLRLGRKYDAALHTLDAASCYLEAGDFGKVGNLARHAATELRRQGANSGALAAIMVLKSACEASTLTAELVTELKQRLEKTPPAAR